MKNENTKMTKSEALVALLDLGRTADERTCRAAMLGAKALARAIIHKARNHARHARTLCNGESLAPRKDADPPRSTP